MVHIQGTHSALLCVCARSIAHWLVHSCADQPPLKGGFGQQGPIALILSPTRELALQIEQVWKQVAKPYYWIIATTLLGGENKKSEKARLRKGVHVVIGTPGTCRCHICFNNN